MRGQWYWSGDALRNICTDLESATSLLRAVQALGLPVSVTSETANMWAVNLRLGDVPAPGLREPRTIEWYQHLRELGAGSVTSRGKSARQMIAEAYTEGPDNERG